MDQGTLNLVRDLGTAGILGVVLLLLVRAIAPLVTMLADAQKDQANARREQTEASKAVLKRWEDSDRILEGHSVAFTSAMRDVTTKLKSLNVIDTQRIKQNDVTAAQITGAREDIKTLGKDFSVGANEAVEKVNKAMDGKLAPIEAMLKAMQQQLNEALALLHSVTAERAPLQTQEHHHTGNVTMSPTATEPSAPLAITGDVTVHAAHVEPSTTPEKSPDG